MWKSPILSPFSLQSHLMLNKSKSPYNGRQGPMRSASYFFSQALNNWFDINSYFSFPWSHTYWPPCYLFLEHVGCSSLRPSALFVSLPGILFYLISAWYSPRHLDMTLLFHIKRLLWFHKRHPPYVGQNSQISFKMCMVNRQNLKSFKNGSDYDLKAKTQQHVFK